MPPRTIDDLGPDAYSRYARDQSELIASPFKEAPPIPSRAEIDVTVPSFPSELDELFGHRPPNLPWAAFTPPPLPQLTRIRSLFTSSGIIPGEISEESQQVQVDRINRHMQAEQSTASDPSEIAQQADILLSLLQQLGQLNKDLIDVNARRGEYQKG